MAVSPCKAGMARTLCPGRIHAGIALLAAIVMLFASAPWMQIGVIALAALAGHLLLTPDAPPAESDTGLRFGRYAAFVAACLFAGLLVALPLLVGMTPGSGLLATADAFYRVGALVFGGGHVALPLLQAELVPPGWIDNSRFVAGYGVAQAVPGPMFTLTAYLGAVIAPSGGPAGGLAGAAVALVAVFLPSVLILVAVLPFWATIQQMPAARAALAGVNAAAVARRALRSRLDLVDRQRAGFGAGPRRPRGAYRAAPLPVDRCRRVGGGGIRVRSHLRRKLPDIDVEYQETTSRSSERGFEHFSQR